MNRSSSRFGELLREFGASPAKEKPSSGKKDNDYDVRPELSILKQPTTAGRNSKRWHLEGHGAT
jgi:hypothetical protein